MAKTVRKFDLLDQPSPSTAQKVTSEYIKEFFKVNRANGSISKRELDKWTKTVEEIENKKEGVKRWAEIRRAFIANYLPHLGKTKTPMTNYLKSLS